LVVLPSVLTSHYAFLPNPAVAGAGAKPSINNSEDLFRVAISWEEWKDIWGGGIFITRFGFENCMLQNAALNYNNP